LVRVCDGNSIIPPGTRVGDVNEPRYGQSASVDVGNEDSPVRDVAFDKGGYAYVVPVVVGPDQDPDTRYMAAAKLELDPNGTYRVVQLYAPVEAPNDNFVSNLREIEVDDEGNVYVLNVKYFNESDALWVYDSNTGAQQALVRLADPCDDCNSICAPDDDSNCIYAPVAMHVSSVTNLIYLGSFLNQPDADSTSLYIISKEGLINMECPNNVQRISIEGMGHITDMTEDPTTGTLSVVGFTMLNIPSEDEMIEGFHLSMDRPFYKPYLAEIPTPCGGTGPVQAECLSDYSDPNFNSLALPLSVVWTGCVDLADISTFAQQWQQSGCNDPDWCSGADLDRSGTVDWEDFYYITQHWLKSCSHEE
jgi:hypothetical protein